MPAPVAASSRLLNAVAARLLADATLAAAPLSGRIYQNLAPPAAVYPLVILAGVTGVNASTANWGHVGQNATFQVTVRGKGGTSTDPLLPILEDIIASLSTVERLVSEGLYIAGIEYARDNPRAPDTISNVVYAQLLSEFRAIVRPA
jgi:hypothetical protein